MPTACPELLTQLVKTASLYHGAMDRQQQQAAKTVAWAESSGWSWTWIATVMTNRLCPPEVQAAANKLIDLRQGWGESTPHATPAIHEFYQAMRRWFLTPKEVSHVVQ